MADNFNFSESGTSIGAAKDIGGVKYQRKITSLIAAGVATDATGGTGTMGADTQRVTVATDDPINTKLATIAALSKAEDSVHASTDTGVMMLAVQTAIPADAAADGDYAALQIKNGRLYVASASTLKLGAYAAIQSALTTEFNSLANAANTAASAAIDNSSSLSMWMDLELNLAAQGVARSAGATITVYMTVRVDGTNFGDTNETTAIPVAVFSLDAATTARRAAALRVRVPPEQFKLFARNSTGQALAASGTTLKYRLYSDAMA